MYIHILGSAAGGGFPQWNCNCQNCLGFRNNQINAQARTQSSIAVSNDGIDWVLLNASPDIRVQLSQFKQAQPARQIRDTAIQDIILMDSQIDHATGLLSLREGCPLQVWCTDMVHEDLSTGFPLFKMLQHWNGGLNWNQIKPSQAFRIEKFKDLEFIPFVIRSAAPPYSPHRNNPQDGDNLALLIIDHQTEKSLFYAPGVGQISPELFVVMQKADAVLVDGTLWTDNEMAEKGVGTKTGQEMGHLHLSGENGMLSILDRLDKPRKILIHINNTNPILNEDSPEYQSLAQHDVEMAFDGMHFQL
ncbi:pyrroloquinoline quinone biosynthesis protein PqqB [Acinetobacter gerneri]|nr:pyrroloquinoline quinone biosynthesis protein PqqB [Acinetobacter gerneri]EPR85135.1 Coenzyme PQQ synthesis protein B [Acinetobacter gerneri DSM 14967 = CIP 107464 = MTCC 9824]